MAFDNKTLKFAGLSTAAAVLAVLCATGVIKTEPPQNDAAKGGDVRVEKTVEASADDAVATAKAAPAATPSQAQPAVPSTIPAPAAVKAAVGKGTGSAVSPAPKKIDETRPIPPGTYHGSGTVIKLMADDLEPPCHQRFLLKLPDGDTLLVVHNIDLAPRLNSLHVGDKVEFCGEFIDNDKGGLVHWTHHDPRKRHKAGWLKHNGKIYE